MNNADRAAYPIHFSGESEGVPVNAIGMTKREHFAAMAMQGLSKTCFTGSKMDIEQASEVSVLMADALLKALSHKEGE